MSFTRSFLKSIGLSDEQIQSVVEEHTNVTDALKKYREDAEKLPAVQTELDDLKKSTADYEEIKTKYQDEKKAFDDYKKNIEEQATLNKVKDAYKALLKASNVDEERLDAILKVTDFTGKKLDKDGKLEGEKDLIESIKTEWKGFIVGERKKGAGTETPPEGNDGSTLSANAQYIRDYAAKRHASIYGETKQSERKESLNYVFYSD